MTNGEKIKEIFPSIEIYEKSHDAIRIKFNSFWWNAKYIEPLTKVNQDLTKNKPENPTSSTTKNDLGVDCISREQAQTEIEVNAYRYTLAKERGGIGQVEWSDQLIKVSDAVDIIRKLPSVTPQEPILDKIRVEIIQSIQNGTIKIESGNEELFRIFDEYNSESEE
jgi:hypothetical protein